MMLPPVLCYHRIGGPLELGVTRVSRRVFARQMQTLAQRGWRTLKLSEFAQSVAASRFPLPASRAFLLTFDDGYDSLASHAYPVLADLGFTATTFLVTDYVGKVNSWDARYTWQRIAHLDWTTIERWRARGFEFASHGATHRRLTWLDESQIAEELGRSRAVLVRNLGAEGGRGIAYPFGACNERVARLAGAAGYSLGFGGVRGNGDPLHLPRVPVYAWDRRVPFGLRDDWLGTIGKVLAHAANRASVGTSLFKRAQEPRSTARST
jgi:peptidoglycan/xylan/chitin deacetylase (PgdA/CDA1 family)